MKERTRGRFSLEFIFKFLTGYLFLSRTTSSRLVDPRSLDPRGRIFHITRLILEPFIIENLYNTKDAFINNYKKDALTNNYRRVVEL